MAGCEWVREGTAGAGGSGSQGVPAVLGWGQEGSTPVSQRGGLFIPTLPKLPEAASQSSHYLPFLSTSLYCLDVFCNELVFL